MNNFNKSSTGISITASVYYDNDTSYRHWQAFLNGEFGMFTVLQFRDYRQTLDYLVITDDPSALYFTRSALRKKHKKELIILWEDFNDRFLHDPLTKDDIIDKVMSTTVKEYYTAIYSNNAIYSTTDKYPTDFYATGYSQGESVKVKVHKVNPEADLGFITKEYVSQLMYDAPVGGSIAITIDPDHSLKGVEETFEFYITELLESEYDYDKQILLRKLSSELGKGLTPHAVTYITGWLAGNLPDRPDYL